MTHKQNKLLVSRRYSALVGAMAGLLLLLSSADASAALNAYLTLKGAKSGDVKGSVTQKGRENTIMVIASNHEVVSPRDPASGLPTGKIMHKPFVITKEIDKATPVLRRILTSNENVTTFKLQFFAPNVRGGAGVESPSLTIELINANIASINLRMLNNKNPELMRYEVYEEIAFTYQRIIWTWNDGNISSEADWESPVSMLEGNDALPASPMYGISKQRFIDRRSVVAVLSGGAIG